MANLSEIGGREPAQEASTVNIAAANAGSIIVTEIMHNPEDVSDQNGEYFELFNTTGSDIDLYGWTISDNEGQSFTIDA